MKQKLLLIVCIGFFGTSGSLWAQYGFGTNNPNASAAMEIVSPDKGVLIPKISLTTSLTFGLYLEGANTASTTHHGMMVFNTNTSTMTVETTSVSATANGLFGPGVYYWHQPDTTPVTVGSWKMVGGQDLEGEFTQSNQVTSSIVTLTLAGDTTPVVLDVTNLEEMQHGNTAGVSPTMTGANPTAMTISPTAGTLFYDTGSSTLWGYLPDAESSEDPKPLIWKLVEGLNLYNSDGTLTASRTVTFDDKDLNFITGEGNFTVSTVTNTLTTTPTFQINGEDNRVYVGTTTFTGTASYTASLKENNKSGTDTPTADLDLVVKGDAKLGRFIVDEKNTTGKIGQALTRTDTGMQWAHVNLAKVETVTETDTTVVSKLETTMLLLEPGQTNMELNLPEIGSENGYPVGFTLKIRRNQGYGGTGAGTSTATIKITPTGTDATIGGATSRSLNMGYQSITLVAAKNDLWAVVD